MDSSYIQQTQTYKVKRDIKAFLLDIDHTITLDEEGREHLIKKYTEQTGDKNLLKEMGNILNELEEYDGSLEGLKNKRKRSLRNLNQITDKMPLEFIEQENVYDNLKIRQGVEEFVQYCKSNQTEVIGISMAYPHFCQHISREYGIRVIACQDDDEKKQAYNQLCQDLGIEPVKTCCVGDGPQDMLHPDSFKVHVGNRRKITNSDVHVNDFYQLLGILSKTQKY